MYIFRRNLHEIRQHPSQDLDQSARCLLSAHEIYDYPHPQHFHRHPAQHCRNSGVALTADGPALGGFWCSRRGRYMSDVMAHVALCADACSVTRSTPIGRVASITSRCELMPGREAVPDALVHHNHSWNKSPSTSRREKLDLILRLVL